MKHPARILAQYGGAVILLLSGFTGDKDWLLLIRYMATAAAITLIYFAVRHGRNQWGVTLVCVALGGFLLSVSPWAPIKFWPDTFHAILTLSCVPFALFSFLVGCKPASVLDSETV
jgi:hypothetical protein